MLGWAQTNTGRAQDSSSRSRGLLGYYDEDIALRRGASSQRAAGGREKSLLLRDDSQAQPLRYEAVVIAAQNRAGVATGRGKESVQVGIRLQPFGMAADVEAPAAASIGSI